MFKRVILEDWHNYVPYIAFGFTFAIFLILTIRAINMKREKAEHMANLPLEKDQTSNQNH